MANWWLNINAAADRRHEVALSGVCRTSGVVLLVCSGKWMEIRNACLYTDINFKNILVLSPEKIGICHAYYFICMAYEGLAEQTESGFGSNIEGTEAVEEWVRLGNEIVEFIENNYTNVDELDFINNASTYRDLAEQINK